MRYPHFRDYAKKENELAAWGKAMGHPARVGIVRLLLAGEESTCGELAEHLPLQQSTISEHLRVLREAGIVRGKADGTSVVYQAKPGLLKSIGDEFHGLRKPDEALKKKLEEKMRSTVHH